MIKMKRSIHKDFQRNITKVDNISNMVLRSKDKIYLAKVRSILINPLHLIIEGVIIDDNIFGIECKVTKDQIYFIPSSMFISNHIR